MSLHIIVDGYNLIRQSPTLSRLDRNDLEEGRQALIAMLAAYKRFKGYAVTVVFDGADAYALYDSRDREKGIRILFSRQGETADAVIKRMAAQDRQKALVVSSDRAVAEYAVSQGAAAISALEFEEKMALAAFMGAKGMMPEAGGEGGRSTTTKKKGPSKRLTKKQRLHRKNLDKL